MSKKYGRNLEDQTLLIISIKHPKKRLKMSENIPQNQVKFIKLRMIKILTGLRFALIVYFALIKYFLPENCNNCRKNKIILQNVSRLCQRKCPEHKFISFPDLRSLIFPELPEIRGNLNQFIVECVFWEIFRERRKSYKIRFKKSQK